MHRSSTHFSLLAFFSNPSFSHLRLLHDWSSNNHWDLERTSLLALIQRKEGQARRWDDFWALVRRCRHLNVTLTRHQSLHNGPSHSSEATARLRHQTCLENRKSLFQHSNPRLPHASEDHSTTKPVTTLKDTHTEANPLKYKFPTLKHYVVVHKLHY